MDHNEAINLQAAEKYVLGELPSEVREPFEEHFVDCPKCALDVQASAAFITAGRQVFQEEHRIGDHVAAPSHGRFTWLHPVYFVPVLATLVLMVGYGSYERLLKHTQQSSATAPAQGTSQNLVPTATFVLHGGDRKADESNAIRVHSSDILNLRFDFLPSQAFPGYIAKVTDRSGRILQQIDIPAERADKEASLVIPVSQLGSGNFGLEIYGYPDSADNVIGRVVSRFLFSVEIVP